MIYEEGSIKHLIDRLSPRIQKRCRGSVVKDDGSYHVVKQGNFVVVLITDSGDNFSAFGIAKRNPADKENGEIALRVAGSRAIRRLLEENLSSGGSDGERKGVVKQEQGHC